MAQTSTGSREISPDARPHAASGQRAAAEFHPGLARQLFLFAAACVFAQALVLPIAVDDAALLVLLRFSSAAWQQGGPGYPYTRRLRLSRSKGAGRGDYRPRKLPQFSATCL